MDERSSLNMTNSLLQEAICNLKIQKIDLIGSEITTEDGLVADELNLDEVISQSFNLVKSVHLRSTIPEDDSDAAEEYQYRFEYILGLRILREEDEENSQDDGFQPLLEIKATFAAYYLSMKEVEEKAIQEFANENVGYHVWPYWREYVHSTGSRLGLNKVLNVPLYTVSQNGQKQ